VHARSVEHRTDREMPSSASVTVPPRPGSTDLDRWLSAGLAEVGISTAPGRIGTPLKPCVPALSFQGQRMINVEAPASDNENPLPSWSSRVKHRSMWDMPGAMEIVGSSPSGRTTDRRPLGWARRTGRPPSAGRVPGAREPLARLPEGGRRGADAGPPVGATWT